MVDKSNTNSKKIHRVNNFKMKYKASLFLYIAIILNLWSALQAEVFTAITDIESLLDTHKKIIDDLDTYIVKEEKRLLVLKKKVELFRKEHDIAMHDVPNYLGNPINAFTLIKRLTTDLNSIEKSIQIGTEFVKDLTLNDTGVKYPTEEDLTGAAQALTRLQKTYLLDTKDLAEGRLRGVAYSSPMTASDCYELGRILYNEKNYENSLSWMMEAFNKYKATNDVYDFTEVHILEYISYLYYLLNDGQKAVDWTYKILMLEPDNERALLNLPHYFKKIIKEKENLENDNTEETEDNNHDSNKELMESVFESLCRGEKDLPHEVSMKLKCRYLTENHAFLKLAPIKTEQVYIDPDIFLFHQVLSDEENEHIKNMAKPRFERAKVYGPNGTALPASYRISKSAWLDDDESPVVKRVSQRVTDFTGLNLYSAELLQVVNYGIGGHYSAHFDFAQKQTREEENDHNNRIATVLFYMSDVAEGGATVFLNLGLSVAPVKNAAVFWLNLHPSCEGDMSTIHGACPVLRGSKWVSNKWLHQEGQELVKPCTLEYQKEEVLRHIISAVPRKL